MTAVPKRCNNATCAHGPEKERKDGRKYNEAYTGIVHSGTGLCPMCHDELIIKPKPATCVGCPLYDLGQGFAWGEGNTNARIMYLGEALGEEEAKAGRPFVGGSGRILNAILASGGIYRESLYITNVCKCRPPGNRAPDDEEIRHCAQYFVKELRMVKPNLIIAAGGTPLYASTGQSKIGVWRGIPTEGPAGTKVMGTYHPAFIMRQQQWWPVAVWDIVKAKAEAEFPEIRRVAVSYDINGRASTHGHDVREAARRNGFLTVDIESTSLDPRAGQIRCYGVGSEIGRATGFDWTLENQSLLLELLSDSSIEKVGQNSEGFDWPYLEYKYDIGMRKGWRIAPKTFDTMVAFHLTNSDLPKNLATISTFYTDMPYWKDDTMYRGSHEDLKLGMCKDVDGTTRSYLGLKHELHVMDMDWLFYNNVQPLQPILREMSKRGLRKDVYKAMKWSIAFEDVANKKEQLLRNVTGNQFLNVASSKDMMKFLYDDLGLPVQMKRDRDKGSRPTADKGAIEALVAMYPENKFLTLVSEIRSARHTKATYVDVETDDNNFVHPRFGTSVAANGRLNSWDPNAQNQPILLRELYIPDDADNCIISIDWNQIEWRLAMVKSADPTGLELLVSGADNHSVVAAECFNIPITDVKHTMPGTVFSYRFMSKFIVYGLGYGRGVKSIAKQLGRPEAWVWDFVNRFFRKFARYQIHRKGLEAIVDKQNYLRNWAGRRRFWYTRQITEMFNFLPSSGAADMMYIACRQAEEQLPKGATVRLTVHDELVIMSQKDVARQAAECLTDIMNQKWPMIVADSDDEKTVKRFYPDGWSCPADCTFGLNHWGECKQEDDPKKGIFVQRDARKALGIE